MLGEKLSNPGFSLAVTRQMMLFLKPKKTMVTTFLHYTKCLIKEFDLQLRKKEPWRKHPASITPSATVPPGSCKSPPGTSGRARGILDSCLTITPSGWLPGARSQPAGRLRQNPLSPCQTNSVSLRLVAGGDLPGTFPCFLGIVYASP